MAKLTAKQQRFVDEYLIDLNATQAAIRAGYSEKTAYSQGQRLLKNVETQTNIQNAMKKREEDIEITQAMVLKQLGRIAFSDVRKLFDADGKLVDLTMLDDDVVAAIAGVDIFEEFSGYGENRMLIGYTKKYKLSDKLKALEMIGKHLGMFEKQANVREVEDLSPLSEMLK